MANSTQNKVKQVLAFVFGILLSALTVSIISPDEFNKTFAAVGRPKQNLKNVFQISRRGMGNNGKLLKSHMEQKLGWTDIANVKDPTQLEEAKANCCIFKWDCFRGCPFPFEPGQRNLNNHYPNNYWVQSKVKSKQLVYELKEWQSDKQKVQQQPWLKICPPVDHWQSKSWESHSIPDMLEVLNFTKETKSIQQPFNALKLIAKAHQSDRGENIQIVFDATFMKRQQGKMVLGAKQEEVQAIKDKAQREKKQSDALTVWMDGKTIQPQLIQTQIERPLLYKGVKFDIRQQILCVRTEPFAVLWHDGFLLTSMVPYETDSFPTKIDPYVEGWTGFKENPEWYNWWEKTGQYIHLTNGSIQRTHKDYHWKKDQTKVSLPDFRKDLDRQGQPPEALDRALDKMRAISTGIFMMGSTKFARHLGLFEIFGLDFLLDQNCNPYLLEVNAIPNLSTETALQQKIKGTVIPGMIDMLVDMHPEFFAPGTPAPEVKKIIRDGWLLLGDEAKGEYFKAKWDHSVNLKDYKPVKKQKDDL